MRNVRARRNDVVSSVNFAFFVIFMVMLACKCFKAYTFNIARPIPNGKKANLSLIYTCVHATVQTLSGLFRRTVQHVNIQSLTDATLTDCRPNL